MRIRTLLAVLGVALASLGTAATTAAEAATTPVTAVTYRAAAQQGSFMQDHVTSNGWFAPSDPVTMTSEARRVEFTAGAAGHLRIRITLSGPAMPGTYSIDPGDTPETAQVGVVVTDADRPTEDQCTVGEARFLETTFGADAQLATFAADLSCGSASPGGSPTPVHIGLRWRSAHPATAVRAVNSADLGSFEVGTSSAARAVRFTALGTPVAFGSASVPDQDWTDPAADFEIVADGCSGRTLAVGSSCTISLVMTSIAEVQTESRLSLPDDSAAGETSVGVSGWAMTNRDARFQVVTPKRILDTRPGSPIGARGFRTLKVRGVAGIPTDAQDIVLSVTAVKPTTSGYLTVEQQRWSPPEYSTLNFRAGETRSNLAVVIPYYTSGTVEVFNSAGSTDVLVDVVGYTIGNGLATASDSLFVPVDPDRALDTRSAADGPLQPREAVDLELDFGAANAGVTSVAVNLTSTRSTAGGYLTTWSGSGAVPTVSQLSFSRGASTPVLAIVPVRLVDGRPTIRILNGSVGRTDVLVDVFGYFDQRTPYGYRVRGDLGRIADTRTGLGTTKGALGPGATRSMRGINPVTAGPDDEGVIVNLTEVSPTATTFVTAWDGSGSRPTTSVLNATRGRTTANAVITGLGATGRFSAYNAAGSTHLVADAMAALVATPASTTAGTAAPAASAGTRSSDLRTGRLLGARSSR